MPVEVYVEDLDELVAAGWVGVAADGGQKGGHVDICADYGVQDPFDA